MEERKALRYSTDATEDYLFFFIRSNIISALEKRIQGQVRRTYGKSRPYDIKAKGLRD